MFCKCGCGGITNVAKNTDKRYGVIKGQHVSFIKGHSTKGVTIGDLERITKYSNRENNGCVTWAGAIDKDGYGIFTPYHQKTKRVTRFIFEKQHGVLKPTEFVCHTCDTPGCININHLFIGTNQDNMDDMKNKGRQSKGATHPKATLSNEEVLSLRAVANKLTQNELAEIYGVSQATVNNLIRCKGRAV